VIVLTQLVYVHPGHEAAFDAFEEVALTAVARHGGAVLLRVRPPAASVLAGTLEPPYEVHLISFPSDEHFARFAADPERARVLHLKAESVRAALLYRGAPA
jgi:uncharacterized protein (DUF1330 family)